MSRPLAVFLLAFLVACDKRDPPDIKPWARPTPRPGSVSCSELASSREGARWERAAATFEVAVAGPVTIADASVLGGPFHAPVTIPDVPAGPHAVDILVGKTRGGRERAICAVVHLRDGEPSTFSVAGDVPVDTDVIAVVDAKRFEPVARRTTGTIVAGVTVEAASMTAVLRAAEAAGVPLEEVLPTLATTTRPALPTDKAAIGDVLSRTKTFGHYVEEPATTGWLFLRALGERTAARVDVPDVKGVGVAIEVGEGSGAYVVAVGMREAPVTIELRISP
jgi:hypothetical protein